MAAGDELLIVDPTEAHREGMRKLFDQAGYVCTAATTSAQAIDLVERKFFPAALIDLDVDQPGAGVELASAIRERSRQTSIVLLTTRRSFDSVVDALRLGVLDVVMKRPDQVDHLRRAVELACDRYRSKEGDSTLLREVRSVLDEAFRVMLDLGRRVYKDVSTSSGPRFKPRVFVVDDHPDFLEGIALLTEDTDWEIVSEVSGGSALDKASSLTFDVVAARDELMDLKGTMLIRSIQTTRPETLGVLYSETNGRIEHYRNRRVEDVEKPFGGPEHVVNAVGQRIEQLRMAQRDRRVLSALRRDHEEFMRRYAELKIRIDRLSE